MKYWLDTEFIERPFGLDLISIGIVCEDGREFYAESSEVDWSRASHWIVDNVRPQLTGGGETLENISYGIRRFMETDQAPVLWGYFAAFDWVAFCGLFGSLSELPFDFPQVCLDVRQWQIELGEPQLPPQNDSKHHALSDARWTREAWWFLAALPQADRPAGTANFGHNGVVSPAHK
ncbi:3'-5' exoribonuclease [Phenylobacterium sp.]|uniref:3'-5' exoribonuclease domain-containing protein n=1 Tax=Phenylobacterium sp. TaxID=1871053 RepID=UPI0030F41800